MPIRRLSPAVVREWHARTALATPTVRAHAYMLLKTICATAVADDLLPANPCRIRGAGQAKRVSKTEPATLDELAALVERSPSGTGSWCCSRPGAVCASAS